MDRSIS